MAATVTISVPLTPSGLAEARSDLDRLAALVNGEVWPKQSGGQAFETHRARRIFKRAVGLRSREILDLLPPGKAMALTPEELGRKMAPWPGGGRLSKASVRAAIRNVQRAEAHLLSEGLIDRRVVKIDFSDYDREGAGRYYVEREDRRILDKSNMNETR
jgi:hypothetical protein